MIALVFLTLGLVVGNFFTNYKKLTNIGVAAIITLLLIGPGVYRYFWPKEFLFDYKAPYIQTAAERVKRSLPNDWRFSIGFKPPSDFRNASVYVVYGEEFSKGKWARIISSDQLDKVMWDAYEHGYDPRTIVKGDEQLIVLFHYVVDKHALNLSNQRDEAELSQYKNLQPGEYRFLIRVQNNETAETFVHLWWYGNPETLRLEVE